VGSCLARFRSPYPLYRNPIYNLPSAYQGVHEIRLGFRILF